MSFGTKEIFICQCITSKVYSNLSWDTEGSEAWLGKGWKKMLWEWWMLQFHVITFVDIFSSFFLIRSCTYMFHVITVYVIVLFAKCIKLDMLNCFEEMEICCYFDNTSAHIYVFWNDIFWLDKWTNHVYICITELIFMIDGLGKNIERHTAHTIVSWPNTKQWVIVHTFDLMMIIRQCIYSLNHHKGSG